ncbi:Imm26 family immunity protein [Chryseomicrobium imtechense]
MTKRRRRKVGDVYAIPLPNGNFAFGRAFRDAGIGIYQHIGNDINDLPQKEEYQFIVGVYESALKSEKWPFVENRPFEREDEEWPPPSCIKDQLSGEFEIYYKGEIRNASKEECEGMEVAAVWEAEHIIDRIMGDDTWTKSLDY